MAYHDYCEVCGIQLEIDFDDEEGMVCAQCKLRNVPGDTERMRRCVNGKTLVLTQADVDILDGSKARRVRCDVVEDVEIKNLYDMYKSL